MTMQVGMIGTDGIVVAGDLNWSNEPMLVNRNWAGGRYGFQSTKMKFDRERGVAVACARDMTVSAWVAHLIVTTLPPDKYDNPVNAITQIGETVLSESGGDKYPAQCIVAFSKPRLRLFLFQYANVYGKWGPLCQEMETIAIAGDNINSALFWVEKYYRKAPLSELIPLAAHLVVSSNELNSATIAGLEIMVCDESGPRRMSKESIQQLEQQALKWDKKISKLFSGYRQQFTYAPDVIG